MMGRVTAQSALLLMVWLFSLTVYAAKDPEQYFFDSTFGDLTEELQTVKGEGKKALMIMFETETCPWCERMKQTVLNQEDVQAFYRQNFRIIAVDAEGSIAMTDFNGDELTESAFALKQLRVRATPVFAFFNDKGELLTKYTGTTKSSADFILLGQYVLEGAYKTKRFSQYKRAHSAANGQAL